MNTYKNIEIAQEFNVSNTTVMRWIDASLGSKNNLQIFKVKDKPKIVKNDHNRAELKKLSDQGVIYKNKILYSEVKPKAEFYETFSPEQVIEMINSLETKKLIPPKFRFLGRGADFWEEFLENNEDDDTQPKLNTDRGALEEFYAHLEYEKEFYTYLEYETRKYAKVNIIDIGCGVVTPLVETLKLFKLQNRLNKYIGIDISPEMLQKEKVYLEDKLPNINIEQYALDIENTDPSTIFFKNKSNQDGTRVCNIIFCIGGVYGNLTNRLKALGNIRAGMGTDDYLVISEGLDTSVLRSSFEHLNMGLNLLIPELLNINVDQCEIVKRFNDELKRREILIRLDKDYVLDFEVFDTNRRIKFYKGQEIVVFQHYPMHVDDVINTISNSGLELKFLNTHEELSQIGFIAKSK